MMLITHPSTRQHRTYGYPILIASVCKCLFRRPNTVERSQMYRIPPFLNPSKSDFLKLPAIFIKLPRERDEWQNSFNAIKFMFVCRFVDLLILRAAKLEVLVKFSTTGPATITVLYVAPNCLFSLLKCSPLCSAWL